MTPPHQRNPPGRLPANLTVLVLEGGGDRLRRASLVFGSGLFAASFEDEYAYISQSYYADLFFAGTFQRSRLARIPGLRPASAPQVSDRCRISIWPSSPCPGPGRAWAWYDHYGHFGTPLTLWVARLPILFVGVHRLRRDLRDAAS